MQLIADVDMIANAGIGYKLLRPVGRLQPDLVKDWTAETQHMQCQLAVAVACLSCRQPA